MRLRPFCYCLVDSKDLLPHNFLVILYLPCLLCMYEILSLCTYLFVFCHLYASFSQAYFIRFHYVYIYCNYLHLQKSKLLRLSFLSKSLKLKCSIFVLNMLVAGQNIDRQGQSLSLIDQLQQSLAYSCDKVIHHKDQISK